ncbi:MAG: prolipoprotein diacylglyceryl transferase [Clostridia bacterium]|nr:prolipoprotein diacylglyceryl transferase [Clostridia bacterium]
MFPVFELFGKEIPLYAIFALIGIFVAGITFCVYIKKCGYDNNTAIVFLLILGVGVVIGGHLLFGITNISKFYLFGEAKAFGEFMKTFATLFGGSVFYGGLLGACIAGLIFMKLVKVPKDVYLDGCAFFAPLFHAFARIGCFFAGCCYGIESSFGFICANNKYIDLGNVRRFPVQLLESMENFLIVGLIAILMKKKKLKGRLFYLYLLIYSVCRFINEFLRGDEIRGFVLGMSTSQFISIFIFAISVILLVITTQKSKKQD